MFELSFESADLLSQDEFARWVQRRPPSDLHHYELLNWRIVMNPPAGYPHGRSDAKVAARLHDLVELAGLGVVLGADQGFALPSGDTVGPDCAVVLRERWQEPPPLAAGDFLALVPDLVVEVLSPSNARYDRGEKKSVYERNGVREYWLLDPRGRRLTIFHLLGGRFDSGQVFEEADTVRSEILPGLEFPLRDLLP